MTKKKSKKQMALEFYDSTPGDHPRRAANLFGIDYNTFMNYLHARRLRRLNRCTTCGHKLPKGWTPRTFAYHARVILGPPRFQKLKFKTPRPRQATQAQPSREILRAPDLL